jgi:hypothetical protein
MAKTSLIRRWAFNGHMSFNASRYKVPVFSDARLAKWAVDRASMRFEYGGSQLAGQCRVNRSIRVPCIH